RGGGEAPRAPRPRAVHLGLAEDGGRRPPLGPADLPADLGEREALGRLGFEDSLRAFGALHTRDTRARPINRGFERVSIGEPAPCAGQPVNREPGRPAAGSAACPAGRPSSTGWPR